MKFSKLLVLSALFTVSVGSAKAAVPDGVWTMPEPQGLEFTTFTDDGTRYYLYNADAKMFFCSGNSWGTQASVKIFGLPFWLEPSKESGYEDYYELWDDFENPERTDVHGAHNVFTDDGGSSWVDHASQACYSWTFEIVGDKVRFQNVAAANTYEKFAGTYIGWDGKYEGSNYSSILRMFTPDTEGVSIDWKAVTEESYIAISEDGRLEAYQNGVKAYFASFSLKKALEDAEAINLDATNAMAVYMNTASTEAELNAATELLNARIALKKTIEEYETKGFTATDAARAVLYDSTADKAAVEEAQKALDAAYVEWGKTQATIDDPLNMTGRIVNPNFDNHSSAGWTSESGHAIGWGASGQDVACVAEHWNTTFNDYQDIEDLPDGLYALGAKTSWRGTWDNMIKGVTGSYLYAVVGNEETKVPFNNIWSPRNTESMAGNTAWGAGATERNTTVDGVQYFSPDNPSAFRVYYEKEGANYYDTKLYFAVTGGKARIGVALPAAVSEDNWTCFDNFTLTYFGNAANVWQFYLDESLKNLAPIVLDEESALFLDEYEVEGLLNGQIVTLQYVQAYNAARTASVEVKSKTEADVVINYVKANYADVQKNIDLWKQYLAAVGKAKSAMIDYDQTESAEILGEYIEFDANEDGGPGLETILTNHNLTNEQLESEIAWIEAKITSAQSEIKQGLKPGDDVTVFLTNPDFESGVHRGATDPNKNEGQYGTAVGWHADKFANGNFTPGPEGKDDDPTVNHCFEAWHCHDFDLWQEITDVQPGVYQINVQGYVRCEIPGYVKGEPVDPAIVPIKLYLNNATTAFPSVYSESLQELGHELEVIESWTIETVNEQQYPNSMGGAGQCFSWDMYKIEAYGLVKKGDPLRIGVRGKGDTDWWCIWDNFKLTYRGFDPEAVKPALEEAMLRINDDMLNRPMGKDVKENAQKALQAAQAVLAENGSMTDLEWGERMYNVLSDIYDAVADVETSVLLFQKLEKAIEDFGNAFGFDFENSPASEALKDEARQLYNTVSEGFENQTLNDEDVDKYIEQMKDMTAKLRIPETTGASDDNPIDMTSVIQSPSFSKVDPETDLLVNSSEGWTNPCNLGNNEFQQSALAMEQYHRNNTPSNAGTFEMYQDLNYLPAGTYMLQVDGFCEMGGTEGDAQKRFDANYAAWKADNNASVYFLYATDGDGKNYSAPLANLMKGEPIETSEQAEYLGQVDEITDLVLTTEEGEEILYYWPTSLYSARAFLNMGKIDLGNDVYEGDGVYTTKIFVKVNEDGKLRVGLKRTSTEDAHWGVWDDFKLFYFGAESNKELSGDAQSVESIAMGQPVKVEFFTLDGRKTNGMQKGINIQKITLDNGTVVVRKVRK